MIMRAPGIIITVALGILLAPFPSNAQAPPKIFRIGVVSAGVQRSSHIYVAFEQRLRDLGYVDGQNTAIEFRTAEGKPDRLPGLMTEMVRLKVDLLFAPGSEANLRAAREATTTIPIVTVAIDYDPIARGYVAGLARPGGNITGMFLRQIELTGKRLEFLKEALPKVARVAVLWDTFSADQLREAEAVARSLGLQLRPLELRNPPYDFDVALKSAFRQRSRGLLITASPVFFRQGAELAQLAAKNRLPAIAPFRELAEAGALMAYGANLQDMFRASAEYADKILKGRRPADLPMQQPTKFELVINLKTAKVLGLTIPRSLLVRADEVIQ